MRINAIPPRAATRISATSPVNLKFRRMRENLPCPPPGRPAARGDAAKGDGRSDHADVFDVRKPGLNVAPDRILSDFRRYINPVRLIPLLRGDRASRCIFS